MTVQEIGERMSGRELQEWIAFDRISPFGDERADLRSGIVSSVIANANRSRGEPFRPSDFMPFLDKPKSTPTDALKKLRTMKRKGIH